MQDLSLVPEEEILDELAKRNDCFIFARRRVLSDIGKTERHRTFSGDKDACVGLCNGVINYILKDTWEQ